MANANSNGPSRSGKAKPQPPKQVKPRPDFPLTPHRSGYFVKKIRGKIYYFGPRGGTPEQALEHYNRVAVDLHAGREPRPNQDGVTLRDLANAFLTDREIRVKSGELTDRTFREYHSACERVIDQFGKGRVVSGLRPSDFATLRESMAKRGWGPQTIANEVQRVRTLFKFAYDADLIAVPVKYGPTFAKPSRKTLRLARAAKGTRMLTPEQIHQLLAAASRELKAMILLALNAGLGNSDVAKLELRHVDLETGWLDYPRPKTGIPRRCRLWRETVDALRDVLRHRKEPRDPELQNRIFITKYGRDWSPKGGGCVVGTEFAKLLQQCQIEIAGSFYSLRHVHATIASGSKDQVACNAIMGHVDESMAGVYRERVDDGRIEAVVAHVRAWLFGGRDNA